LSNLALWVQHALLPWGSWGLAAAAVLDSSFVPFPSGVDLWLITLCVSEPARAPLYVVVAAVGSVAGAAILWLAVRKGEEAFLKKNSGTRKLDQVRQKVERFGFWALLVAALLPPPAPFKLFILAAGVLRYPIGGFVTALLAGRVIRYALEAFLAVRYGHQAWQLLLRAGPAAIATGVLLLVLIFVVVRLRRRAFPERSS